jgi:uncharacterized secreted protein with C-terminal beta-propeller domain
VFDKNLKQLGQIGGFSNSVRFIKDKGYSAQGIIDLSNPKKPKMIAGSLKTSNLYLQPISDKVLLGFDESDGLKLSLFDISNPNKLKEISVSHLTSS